MIDYWDEVFHRPTGEIWVVARAVTDCAVDFVEPAGWPAYRARPSDCNLLEKGRWMRPIGTIMFDRFKVG